MTGDLANFRPQDILTVYGERPRCFLSGVWQFCDGHHILGRGYDHGARKTSGDRQLFSSIFNFAPLNRDIHQGPQRDATEMRWLLLRLARRNVLESIRRGAYEITELDDRFLAFAERWRQDNPA